MTRLAEGFRSVFPRDDVIVYLPGAPKPVAIGSVKKKEMLFDLLVAEWVAKAVPATHGNKSYPRLKPPIWAVESEVDTGAAQVLFDFNKLLLAAAPNRLMVTKVRKSNRRFAEFLRDAATGHNFSGPIYVAYVPSFSESPQKQKQASPEWREVR